MTKSLGADGRRIQIRGAVYFIKAVYQSILFLYVTTIFCIYPEWLRDHFVALRADSVYFMPCLHILVSVPCFYCWELIANRYGKLSLDVIVHHWISAIFALCVLFGLYSLFGTLFGLLKVVMAFPLSFALGFRAQFSNQYPNITRKAFILAFWWWSCMIAFNVIGQTLLILNYFLYHFNEDIPVWVLVVTFFVFCGWFADDYHLLMSMRAMSKQPYEKADFFVRGITMKYNILNVTIQQCSENTVVFMEQILCCC